jgi:hypothetical protein
MTEPIGSTNGGHGALAEDEARRIAAQLGLADFVYKAELVERGGGNREPGDALICANGLGAIVQVKSRDPATAGSDSATRVQQWVEKHGKKAASQAAGTRRQLMLRKNSGSPVLALPVRAGHLPIEEQQRAGLLIDLDVNSWPTIVVLDHPLAEGARPPLPASVFWITLEDWRSLHDAIKSTTGVLTYVKRVLEAEPIPRWTLGTEGDRYAAFVSADRQAASESGTSAGYFDWSVIDRPLAVDLYRDIMRRLWPEDGALPSVSIDDYRLILEHLDSIPPGLAADLGEWIYRKRQYLDSARSWASGFSIDDDRVLVYACDHAKNYEDPQRFDAELMALTATRSSELIEHRVSVNQALGVGLLQGDGWLDYRFAFMKPPIDIPRDVRFTVQQQRGAYDAESLTVKPVGRVRRNEPCPCGSGQKFKRCHGTA